MEFLPGFARRVGYPGHLFFESAMGRGAPCLGGVLCPHLDLADLAVAAAAGIRRFHRVVCRRGRLVDIDFAVTSSTVAPGSRGDAARHYRR